jgi:hypothetical protein
MTKKQFLLSVAIDCVQFGEGCEFQFREVLEEGGLEEKFEELYDVPKYHDDMSDEEDEKRMELEEKARRQLRSDIVSYLKELAK